MTSSQDWDSGSSESTTYGQHSATTDPLATGSDPASGGAAGGSSGSGDSGDAKERAQQAAGTAKEEGAHVAETAKSEAQQVVGEAKNKAADLLGEARTQIDQQSKTQLQTLASKLEELSGEVDSMVEGSNVQGTVTELARQLSDKTRSLSQRLSEREPMDLLEDVRGFARQRPGAFLAGALVAGVVAGRLTRGAKKAHDGGSSPSTSTSLTSTPSTSTSSSAGAPTTGSTFGGTSAPTAGDFSGSTGGLAGGQSVPTGQNTGGRL
jgi:F0F1-type ATP synthase membrane subunit b/b'